MTIPIKAYRLTGDEPVDLDAAPTSVRACDTRADFDAVLAAHVKAMQGRQAKLYAAGDQALLIILQGMDAAGKDGVIKHVMSGVNPQGCRVTSFKQPSAEDLRHDFLWRAAKALPEHGMIGLFNRSYYEDVLVVRVHREMLAAEGRDPDHGRKRLWRDRYRSIRDFEAHLSRNGVRIVKIFLHLSKEEQRKRFLSRIDEADKTWKLSTADIEERQFWSQYRSAYAKCLEATATKTAPWWVVPADDKPSARLIVSQIVLDTLDDMDLHWPKVTDQHRAQLLEIRRRLTTDD